MRSRQALADEPTDLLLAALEGEDALADQLSAAPGKRYSPPGTTAAAPDPVGACLSSVTVKGFRGIGPAATLPVEPGPGLTLVVGRNGSGKSSFAEGLEVLLTGKLMRFKDAPAPVRDGWPCKHAAGDPEVTAEFYVEGKGKTTVSRSRRLAGTRTW
jgi:AAA domain